jgi:hypothetical protein
MWSHANQLDRIGHVTLHLHVVQMQNWADGAEDSPQSPPGSHHHNHTVGRGSWEGPKNDFHVLAH